MKEYKVKANGYWQLCYIKADNITQAIKLGAKEIGVGINDIEFAELKPSKTIKVPRI